MRFVERKFENSADASAEQKTAAIERNGVAAFVGAAESRYNKIMIDFKTMIIATDGSESAGKAISVGAALAKTTGAEVVVVHALLRTAPFELVHQLYVAHGLDTHALDKLLDPSAIVPPTSDFLSVPPRLPVPAEALRKLGQKILDDAKAALLKEGIMGVRLSLEENTPERAIVDAAVRFGADVVVMGQRGLSSLQELIFGSVSTKVSRTFEQTVITVK